MEVFQEQSYIGNTSQRGNTRYLILTRLCFINLENDMITFYDKLLCAVSILVSRKYWANKQVISVHVKNIIIEELKYKLKLSTKVSETEYRYATPFSIHGTGYRFNNAQMIYCFISCNILEYHRSKA